MAEVGSHFWRSTAPTPPLNTGPPREPAVQDHAWTAFEYLQGWRLHNLFGQSVQVLCSVTVKVERKYYFIILRRSSLYFYLCSLPFVLSLGTERSLALSSTVWGIRYVHTLICPLEPFLLQAEQSQLSQLVFIEEMLQFIITVGLCWACTRMSVTFLYWGAQNWTHHCRYVSLELNRREGSHPSSCW